MHFALGWTVFEKLTDGMLFLRQLGSMLQNVLGQEAEKKTVVDASMA